MLAGGLRAWLEDGVAAVAGDRPSDAAPVVVTGRRIAGTFGGGDPDSAVRRESPLQGPQVLGALTAVLFRQAVSAGLGEDPLDDALAGLDAEPGGEAVTGYVNSLRASALPALTGELERTTAHLVRDWSAVPAGWLPRTNDPVNIALAGGRVVLAGTLDLVLGAPSDGTASVCLVDVCSGARRSSDRTLRHYHALLETLRTGAAPFRVATYYTRDGSLVVDEVDDDLLSGMVDVVVAAVVHACGAAGDAPTETGGRRVDPDGTPNFTGAAPAAVLSPTVLPRATALADALLGEGGHAIDPSLGEALGKRVALSLGQLAAPPDGRRTRIDGYALAAGVAAAGQQASPFRWTSRSARRALALTAVSDCVAGRSRTPGEAVGVAMGRAIDEAGQQWTGPRALGVWLGTLPAGGRAVVAAEATRWATLLWAGVDWDRLGQAAEVGGPDRWWNTAAARWLGVRGRADVRAATDGRPVLLTVGAGRPSPTSRAELLLPALVDVLNEPNQPAPARVIGWWPAAGRSMVVPVDEAGLAEVARLVCVRAAEAAHRPARVDGATGGGADGGHGPNG
jgi:hypothetical protein